MSALEIAPERETAPVHPERHSDINKKFLYILMTPYLHSGYVLTQRHGETPKGDRNIVASPEGNAIQILNNELPGFSPKSGAWRMNEVSNPYGMAVLMQRAHEKRDDMHDIKDLRDLSPLEPIPDHDKRLELHDFSSIYARIALQNLEDKIDNTITPSRVAEELFLRKYREDIQPKLKRM